MFRAILLLTALVAAPTIAADRPNVLLICVDDLRPELGCFGESHMHTPSLDRFAATARVFRRHYVQLPTCGASRYALMSGHYPRTPAAWGNGAFNGLQPGDALVMLPEAFRAAGYWTQSIGKVSHQPSGRRVQKEGGEVEGPPEMPDAWDQVGAPVGKWKDPWSAFFGYADGSGRQRGKSRPIEAADVPDAGYPDGLIAASAIEALGRLSKGEKPFFLAVGFYKPHLPFNAPKSYWDRYQGDGIEPAPWSEPPRDLNSTIPLHRSGEFFGNYGGHPQDARTNEDYARRVRHAYFASVSYVDAQIGKVIDSLNDLNLAKNTVVVVWGDHGWHLGDHGIWGKHTLFERSLRSALIVRAPGIDEPGKATDALVGSVDLYPTLAELCGLDAPDDLDGRSFAGALRDPGAPGKRYVRGFWRLNGHHGHTVRLDRYRVTIWSKGGKVALTEVYDHASDPNETRNVAAQKQAVIDEARAIVGEPGS